MFHKNLKKPHKLSPAAGKAASVGMPEQAEIRELPVDISIL